MGRAMVGQEHDVAISLIVCTMGRRDELGRLFDSLCRQTFADFDVLVVDQNAPGFLDPVLAAYADRLRIGVVTSSPGLSLARNVGLGHARGRFVAFPDDDCWYDADTLTNAVGKLSASASLALVSGRTLDGQGRPSVSLSLPEPAWVTRRNYLMCGNSNGLFFRRAVFDEIGRFDVRLGVGARTEFQSGEEADIILRVIDAGLAAHYFPDLVVRHDQVDARITDAQLRRARNYGRGFGALLRKHRFPALVIAYRVARPLLGAAVHLLRGKPALARYKWTWGQAIADGYRRWPPGEHERSFGVP